MLPIVIPDDFKLTSKLKDEIEKAQIAIKDNHRNAEYSIHSVPYSFGYNTETDRLFIAHTFLKNADAFAVVVEKSLSPKGSRDPRKRTDTQTVYVAFPYENGVATRGNTYIPELEKNLEDLTQAAFIKNTSPGAIPGVL